MLTFLDVGHEEQAAAEVTGASPPKEPIIDHLRKLFAKKPTDASAASPPAEDTTAPEGTNVTETDDHPTVPTDLPTAEGKQTNAVVLLLLLLVYA